MTAAKIGEKINKFSERKLNNIFYISPIPITKRMYTIKIVAVPKIPNAIYDWMFPFCVRETHQLVNFVIAEIALINHCITYLSMTFVKFAKKSTMFPPIHLYNCEIFPPLLKKFKIGAGSFLQSADSSSLG